MRLRPGITALPFQGAAYSRQGRGGERGREEGKKGEVEKRLWERSPLIFFTIFNHCTR